MLERLVGNPVHVYTLLWRMVTRLPEIITGNVAKTIGWNIFSIYQFFICFWLLPKLFKELPSSLAALAGSSDQSRLRIEAIVGGLAMPDLNDVEGAAQALVRIQFAYR